MTIKIEKRLKFDRIQAGKAAVMPEALAEGMEHIRAIAAPRTPIETGHLVGTAHVEVDAATKTASLIYDGPYARYQHYELQLKHETGQALYLESSINDGASEALAVVGRRIKGAI